MVCSICLILIFEINTPEIEQEVPAISYELLYPIELPEEPGYELEYKFSREPHQKWDREDVFEYFTIPEGENLDRLTAENEKLILDILEAAP